MITIIIPRFNEQETIRLFYEELNRVSLEFSDTAFDILFVNDGSKDDTLAEIKRLSLEDDRSSKMMKRRFFSYDYYLFFDNTDHFCTYWSLHG
jgi:glycosyltransferase involved in cell wall biosynthesis